LIDAASGTISNPKSTSTSLWKRTLASYFPKRLIVFPGILMFFFSISTPAFTKASAKSALLIDPNNLSPEPTLASILTTKPSNLAAFSQLQIQNLNLLHLVLKLRS